MNPEQPGAAGPSNPYQFIMEPPKAPKKPLVPAIGGGNPFIMRLVFVIGGAVIFMIVAAIVVNVLFSSKTNVPDLVTLTQQETEILRVVRQQSKLADQNTKNAAATAMSTVESHLQVWVTALKDHGREMADEEFALKLNAATDTKLKAAEQSNTYDTAFREVIHGYLTTYASQLKAAYDNTTLPAEQKTLEAHFDETSILIKQFGS